MLEEKHIVLSNIKFRYIFRAGNEDTIPVLFLHGFSGRSDDWTEIMENLPAHVPVYAIDLIGHGGTESPQELTPYTTQSQITQLHEFILKVLKHPPVLTGYSMGGRLALQYTVLKKRLSGLILESTTAGIILEEEKQRRIVSDNNLIKIIAEQGVEQFIDYWMALPLFKSLKKIPPEKYGMIVENKKRNNPTGLMRSLEAFGSGRMPSVFHRLSEIDCPTLIIAGGSDEKYTSISRDMAEKINGSSLKIIEGAGHNTHLEKPEEFLNFVLKFLNKIGKG